MPEEYDAVPALETVCWWSKPYAKAKNDSTVLASCVHIFLATVTKKEFTNEKCF